MKENLQLMLFFGIMFLFASCQNKTKKEEVTIDSMAIYNTIKKEFSEEKDKTIDIGRYLYMDKQQCVHLTPQCVGLINVNEDTQTYEYAIKRCTIYSLRKSNPEYYCAFCVSDEAYDSIQKMIVRESVEEVKKKINW